MEFYFFLLALLFLFLILIVGLITFKNNYKRNYSFIKCFPCELEHKNVFPYVSILNVSFFFLITVSEIYAFIVNKSPFVIPQISYSIGVLLIILNVLNIIIFISKISDSFKLHVFASSYFFTLSIAFNIFIIIYIFYSNYYSKFYLIYYILAIISEVILLCLPKIKYWYKKEQEYKINILGFSEWIYFAINIISYALILLMNINL